MYQTFLHVSDAIVFIHLKKKNLMLYNHHLHLECILKSIGTLQTIYTR